MDINGLASGGTNGVKTYSSLGKMGGGFEQSPQGSFLDLLKQPLSNALEAGKVHEETAIRASQDKANSLELLQAATGAELSIQEFKAYWDKFMTAVNDVTKINL